ncbi:hypothetical protein [Streptomyces guryensis]|uniref:Secreted protein n=1 Tax=Streptomyces guryensis TaxID=2886947 RepID=A0A9Q3VUV6_9ACTN|nr:hypothetical protein [Streptomyces guryensis]MCD9878177.1 hypothetical protein [Streptomyces guryensis]
MAKRAARIASLSGALVTGLILAAAPAAYADSAGAYAGHDWNARASASVTSAVVVHVHALDKGTPDRIICWGELCEGKKKGGTYRCTSGGAQHNTWTPLDWGGRKVWVADECVDFGRVA